MTAEYLTTNQSGLAGLGLVAGSWLYSLGGRDYKWLRRYLGSFVLAATVNLLCLWRGLWSPWFLLIYPFLIGGTSLGYGADDIYSKLIKRVTCAIAICFSGLLLAFILGGNAWWVLIPHIGVGLFSVFLGTKNPLEAPAEEFFICLMLCTGLMMYPFVGI